MATPEVMGSRSLGSRYRSIRRGRQAVTDALPPHTTAGLTMSQSVIFGRLELDLNNEATEPDQ